MHKWIGKIIVAILCLSINYVYSKDIEIKIATLPDVNNEYYLELLSTALKNLGHTVQIRNIGSFPAPKISEMLDKGEVSLFWYVQSSERDQKYLPITTGLTNNLIGKRILLIPKNQQPTYDPIKDLASFKTLSKAGGFGKGWFDVKVWQANNLKYIEEEGNWQVTLYKKVAAGDRGIDYFSRGVTEILGESAQHPELSIENNLIFVYNRDFRFYLSKSAADIAPILEEALKKANTDGVMQSLIQKYWGESFTKLNIDKRIVIPLVSP